MEVAGNLVKIFKTFSAPLILHSDNGREFVNKVCYQVFGSEDDVFFFLLGYQGAAAVMAKLQDGQWQAKALAEPRKCGKMQQGHRVHGGLLEARRSAK